MGFPTFGVIYKAPILSISGCGFISSTGFSDVAHYHLCTTLTSHSCQQNYFYVSNESKTGQLLWFRLYVGEN